MADPVATTNATANNLTVYTSDRLSHVDLIEQHDRKANKAPQETASDKHHEPYQTYFRKLSHQADAGLAPVTRRR
jgi:hypothetical protein